MTSDGPYKLSQTLERLLVSRCFDAQPPLQEQEIAHLARSVKKIADSYTDGHPEGCCFSDPDVRTAYSAYYLPCNAIKLFPILYELKRRGLLLSSGSALRALDLGCGPGTLFAGLLDFCHQYCPRDHITLNLTGIDRNAANCTAAHALIETFATQSHDAPAVTSLRFLAGDMQSPSGLFRGLSRRGGFDLIMAGNCINELDGRSMGALASQTAELLEPGGMIIILDPGTHRSFRNLLLFREEMLSRHGMYLIAPCLQPGTCPLHNDEDAWCHEKLFWTPPRHVALVDQRTGFTKHKGVKFSYLVLSNNRPPDISACGHDEKIWRVISYVIRNKGEERLYVCDGHERRLLRRLSRVKTGASADFSCSERGDVVCIRGAVPRKNFYDIGPATVFQKIF
jgi:ribosomal protein RSM22 (predicted rRNA methylase)